MPIRPSTAHSFQTELKIASTSQFGSNKNKSHLQKNSQSYVRCVKLKILFSHIDFQKFLIITFWLRPDIPKVAFSSE